MGKSNLVKLEFFKYLVKPTNPKMRFSGSSARAMNEANQDAYKYSSTNANPSSSSSNKHSTNVYNTSSNNLPGSGLSTDAGSQLTSQMSDPSTSHPRTRSIVKNSSMEKMPSLNEEDNSNNFANNENMNDDSLQNPHNKSIKFSEKPVELTHIIIDDDGNQHRYLKF